jgi:hypothetical protein
MHVPDERLNIRFAEEGTEAFAHVLNARSRG